MLNAARRAVETENCDDWFRHVVESERDALTAFVDRAPSVEAIVRMLAAETRPIVCAGIGKSGLVAAKVAATFSSLGTPAFFLNAAEAAHGDLGAVQDGNVVLLFSNSGSTEEILRILPLLKGRRCRLVGILGRAQSPLARAVDHLVLASVEQEADHIGMSPTASTTLQMAIGDALAVAVSRTRAFTREDFLRQHPAGLLGRHLIPVKDLMRTGDDVPVVLAHASVGEVIATITAKRVGAACVVDWEHKLQGLVVDGDIRRLIQEHDDIYGTTAGEIMQDRPVVVDLGATVSDVLLILQEHQGRFLVLPVVDRDGRLHGLLHSYDVTQ